VNKKVNNSLGIVLWFTGLSGSGKTTTAKNLYNLLRSDSISTIVLDGDEIRNKQHSSLGFTEKDIKQNNILIAELCLKYRQYYDVVLVPIISPYRQSRKEARAILLYGIFEIFFSASIEFVKKMDAKGLYAKFDKKEINNLIGVAPSNPYEPPKKADLVINIERQNIDESVNTIYKFVIEQLKNNKEIINESK